MRIQLDGIDEISGRLSLRQSNFTGADIYYDGISTNKHIAIETFTSNGISQISQGKALWIPITSQDLHIAGDLFQNSTASDTRLKQKINTLEGVLNKLDNLRGVSFEWNHHEKIHQNNRGKKQLGVVADEFESEFPELIKYDEDGYKHFRYENLSAVVLQAVKELKQMLVEEREQRIALNKRVEDLEKSLQALKEQMK